LAANALAQSRDHILGFFTMLKTELAFYVASVTLQEKLSSLGLGVSLPGLYEKDPLKRSFEDLYDVALALTLNQRISGNTIHGDGKTLIIVTGANQGGKSTFLRSLGQAQLMLQCGMFVGARNFSGSLCGGIFTHFKRKEDAQMKSGKLDEEMDRMDRIIQWIQSHSMVLFNESFASTNEREGSELSRQITKALVDRDNTVVFVTHQFDFAYSMYEKDLPNALFLKAERLEDSKRTFKMIEGTPEARVHGEDLYRTMFSEPVQEARNASAASW
jgi:DNA mismatch repair ATPase MutS